MTYNFENLAPETSWIRKDGWFAGVCEGLGDSFDIHPDLLRLGWVIAFFIFGIGLFVYLGLALTLPKEGQVAENHRERFLGVCYRLHLRTGIELGLIRFLTLFLAVSSFGTVLLLYLVLWFLLPEPSESY